MTMVTTQITNPVKTPIGNDNNCSDVILAIAETVKKTCPSLVGKNIVDIWKICMKVLDSQRYESTVGDSAILAMHAAKKIWKELTTQTNGTPTLNTQ